MAITKETVVDKIEVLEMGQVQVRTATKIVEDGNELTGEDAKVQAICNAVWTDEVKTAYQEMKDAQSNLGD